MIYKTHESTVDMNKLRNVVEELIESIKKTNHDLGLEMQNFDVHNLRLRIIDSAKKIKNNEQILDDLIKEIGAINMSEFEDLKEYIINIKNNLQHEVKDGGRHIDTYEQLSNVLIDANNGASMVFSKTEEVLDNLKQINDCQLNYNEDLLNESSVVGEYSYKINDIISDYIQRNERVLNDLLKINEVIIDISKKFIEENKKLKNETGDINKVINTKDAKIVELQTSQIKLYQKVSKFEEECIDLKENEKKLNESIHDLQNELSIERKSKEDLKRELEAANEELHEKTVYIEEFLNKTLIENFNKKEENFLNIYEDDKVVSTVVHNSHNNDNNMDDSVFMGIVNMCPVSDVKRKSIHDDIVGDMFPYRSNNAFDDIVGCFSPNLDSALVEIDCLSEDDSRNINEVRKNIEKSVIEILDSLAKEKKDVYIPDEMVDYVSGVRDLINKYKENSIILDEKNKDLSSQLDTLRSYNLDSKDNMKLINDLQEELNVLKLDYQNLIIAKKNSEAEFFNHIQQIDCAKKNDQLIFEGELLNIDDALNKLNQLRIENDNLKKALEKKGRKKTKTYSLDDVNIHEGHDQNISLPNNVEKHRKYIRRCIDFITDGGNTDMEEAVTISNPKDRFMRSHCVVNGYIEDFPNKVNNTLIDIKDDSTNEDSLTLSVCSNFQNVFSVSSAMYLFMGVGLLFSMCSVVYSISKDKSDISDDQEDVENQLNTAL